MTKIEALRIFTNARRRDTWLVYGGAVYPATQTEYMKDDIFQLDAPGTIWDNAIMYCNTELHLDPLEPIDWADYVYNSTTNLDLKNSLSIISPYFYCILTETQLNAIAEPADPSFIGFASLSAIDIDDDELNTILLEVGVPFITLEELEFRRDDILKLMIKPALDEYYKWFPIRTVEQFPVPTAMINIPIPPYAKTVIRAYINPGYPITGQHLNPITRYFDEVVLAASSRGTFANPAINYRSRQKYTDIQAYSTFLLEKAVRQGAVNHGSRKRIRVEMKNSRIVGYSNIQGVLEVEWGSPSYIWADVPYNRLSEVREFAQSKILRALGNLRSMANTTLPGTLNFENMITRADALETKILTLWKDATKAVIIRS